MDQKPEDTREPYESPELTMLASVEDATLSTPENVGSDGVFNLSFQQPA
jgi:hypothetical protein